MTVVELVERERARVRTRVVGAGVAAAITAGALVAAAGGWALADARWLTLPRALPALIWVVGLLLVGAAFVWTRVRLGRDASRGRVAAAIERERALRSGQLRGAIEIAESGSLGRLAAGQLARELTAYGVAPLAPRLNRTVARRALVGASAAAVALALSAVAATTSNDGFAAVLHPAAAWRGTLLPAIRFAGVPALVVRGEPLRLRVEAPGRRSITVASRQTGRAWRSAVVPVSAAGVAVVDFGAVDADLAFAATDGRASSDTARVRVTDRAFVGEVTVRAEYPAYLDRAAEQLAAAEPLRVPRGTTLVVRGRASTALAEVALASGANRVALATEGHQFVGRLVADASGRWAWAARSAAGVVPEMPPPLDVDVLPDSMPAIEITRPTTDSVVDGLAPVRVAVTASDDHGLAGVALRVWREGADGAREAPNDVRLAADVPIWSGETLLDLSQRKLTPGQRLNVQAVAVDASPWRQTTTSRVLVLRVPSASELRAQARDAADSAVARAIAAAQTQRDLQQRTSEAARSREAARSANAQSAPSGASAGDKAAMSYDAAERAKSLAQQQRQLAKEVESLQEQAKALERQLKQAGALDTSLARQMQDVQKLLRDALTQELSEQLRSLEQSAAQLSGSESRQALEQLAAQQRALREQLERSVEMLKRAALEGAMQTLRDEARDLAQEQRREADRLDAPSRPQTPQPAPGQRATEQGGEKSDAQRSRELADRSRDLSREIDDLEKRLKNERADFGAQKTAEAGEHAERSADAMQRAAQREQAAERRAAQQQDAQPGAQRQQGAQRQGAQQQQQGGQQQQQQGAQQQGAQQQGAQQQGAQQQGAQQQGGQQQQAGQQGAQQRGAQPEQAGAARRAADEMQRAADQLASARQGQIEQWKSELSGELDQAIQEVMQMAREQSSVEQKARSGQDPSALRAEQSAVQQGVDQTAERLDQAGKKSSLLSQRAQRAMGDARQEVAQASQSLQQQANSPGGQQSAQRSGGQAADAMREAGEALNRAAAALVRDRERVNGAQSASGFSEMLEQMKQLAQQQGQINQQALGMPIPMPGASGQGARDAARQLAQKQRGVAEKLEEVGDGDPSGRSDALAREARQLAQALERVGADPSTVNRQQQLYRRLLDAGRTMEQDERDESGKREAKSGAGVASTAPADGAAAGRSANKFELPAWADLRGLTPDERRLVIEYFRRLNSDKP